MLARLPPAAQVSSQVPLVEGLALRGSAVDDVVRLALREVVWCRLESPSGFFVHFGYDYYMYVGTPEAIEPPTVSPRVFVEEFPSPYRREA